MFILMPLFSIAIISLSFWIILYQVDQFPVKIDWFPEYTDLRRALDIYGFLFKFSSSAEHESLGNSRISILVYL